MITLDAPKDREVRYEELIEQLVDAVRHIETSWESVASSTVLDMSRYERKNLALALIDWLRRNPMPSEPGSGLRFSGLQVYRADEILEFVLKSRLPFEREEIPEVFDWSRRYNHSSFFAGEQEAVSVVENYLQDHELTPDIEKVVRDHIAWRERRGVYDAACRRRLARLRLLVGDREELPLTGGEPWSDAAIEYVIGLPEKTETLWADLIRACSLSSGPRPTATWKGESIRLVAEIGFDEVKAKLFEWFALLDRPRSAALYLSAFGRSYRVRDTYVEEVNADVLKGFVWLLEGASGEEVAEALAELARLAYFPVPKVGPRCAKVGNACVWVLGTMSPEYSREHLLALQETVRSKTAQKEIAKSIERVSF